MTSAGRTKKNHAMYLKINHNGWGPHHKIVQGGSTTKSQKPMSKNILRGREKNLFTKPAKTDRPSTFLFFHHICLRTVRAPLLKAVACPAMTSVLSTSNSILSPLLKICSTLCTITSLTWFSSFCARESSSEGGAVLYVCIKVAMVGPRLPCRPYAGISSGDDDDGADVNC